MVDSKKPKKLSDAEIAAALTDSSAGSIAGLTAIGESILGGKDDSTLPDAPLNDSAAAPNVEAPSPATDSTGPAVSEISHASQVGQKSPSRQRQVMDKFREKYGDEVQVTFMNDTKRYALATDSQFSRDRFKEIFPEDMHDKLKKDNPHGYVKVKATSTWVVPNTLISAAMASTASTSLDELQAVLRQAPGFEKATIRQAPPAQLPERDQKLLDLAADADDSKNPGDSKLPDNIIIDLIQRDALVPAVLENNCDGTNLGLLSIEKRDKNALIVPMDEMHKALGIGQSQQKG